MLKTGKKYKLLFFLFLFSSLFSNIPFAFSEQRHLTLKEAYTLSLKNLEGIQMAKETLYQFYQNRKKALSTILPSLSFDLNYTRYSRIKGSRFGPQFFVIQPRTRYNYGIRISQSIYQGGREWSALRQADYLVKAKKKELANLEEEALLQVAQAYYGVIESQREVEIKKADLKRAKERKRVARVRFEVGEVTRALLLREEAEVARIEAELIRARKNFDIAKERLARLIGIKGDFLLEPPPEEKMPPMDMNKLIDVALKNRSDYLKALAELEVAKEGVNYAIDSFFPTLRINGVYTRFGEDPLDKTFFNKESINATLVLSFPLYQGGLRIAEVREARSKLRAARFNLNNIKKNIELEIKDSYYTIQAIRSAIKSHEKQLAAAKENYDMVFKQFKYGLATNVDVIDANSALVAAQEALMISKIQLQLAILQLKRRMGILLKEIID